MPPTMMKIIPIAVRFFQTIGLGSFLGSSGSSYRLNFALVKPARRTPTGNKIGLFSRNPMIPIPTKME